MKLDCTIARGLSERQREVLVAIATGENTKRTAGRLGLGVKTVEYHRAKLMARLKIFEVANLTRFAIRAGFIDATRGAEVELRAENERLKRRVADLEGQLNGHYSAEPHRAA